MTTIGGSPIHLTEEDIVYVPGMHSRWVRLANGSKAHYVTSGETGPAIILAHGGIEGSSGTAGWRFQAPFLGANGFRVYCPDQPGFGWSDTSSPEYLRRSPKDHVDFIKMFADALCLDKFFISGNSMGCDGTDDSMRVLMEGIIYAKSAIWPELVTMRVKAAGRQRAARAAAGLPIT